MSSFDFSLYDNSDLQPKKQNSVLSKKFLSPSSNFDFSDYDFSDFTTSSQEDSEESFLKSTARTALQVPQGLAEVTGPGLLANFWSFLAQGDVNDPEEMERIRAISEREGIPFDEEAYLQGAQNALSSIPTVSNIARQVEASTGLPLEPQTRTQKGLRFASSAAKLSPKDYTIRGTNTSLPRPILGGAVEGAREGLIEVGVPEPIADIASFGILKAPTSGAASLNIAPVKKESGLTTRQYEKLQKPREVSPSTINKINQSTEKEFRDLANKIVEESPVSKTYKSLAEDPTFKAKSQEAFKDVEKLSESLPHIFESSSLKSDLKKITSRKQNEGLTPSEFDKAHNKFIQQYIKETPNKPFTAKELVKQYRKNNAQLTEAFEPGQSFAYNRAKREALLDYNNIIAEIIEKQFPNSEFSNLFKETNKTWTEISNSQSINKFLDELFDGKINFKKGRDFFDKQGMTVPFQKALGKEGFSKFQTLLGDLLSSEQAMKLLKSAEERGFSDLAKSAGSYLLHPNVAKAKIGFDVAKKTYNKIFEMVLDKPQIAVTWDRGINAMKKGNFKAAEKEFNAISAQEKIFDAKEKSRVDALKNFNKRK